MLIGAGSTITVIALAGLLLLLLPSAPLPADVLPANRTVALFSHITDRERRRFSSLFPSLKDIPLDAHTVAVAFVRLPDESIAGVLFRTPAPLGGSLPFTVSVSGPEANDILKDIGIPLSHDPLFRLLVPKKTMTHTWAYLNVPTLGNTWQLQSPVVFLPSKTGFDIFTVARDASVFGAPLQHAPPRLFDIPLFVFHASDARAAMEALSMLLRDEPSVATESVLRGTLAEVVGPDVSPRYDLLPLLAGQTALHVSEDPRTHALQFVLIGSTSGTPEESARLQRVVASMIAQWPTTRTISRTFDDKYVFRAISADDTLLQRHSTSSGAWKVETVTQAQTGQTVLLARNHNDFIVSNAPAAFTRALAMDISDVRDSLEPLPAALGLFQRDWTERMLREKFPTLVSPHPFGTGTGRYIQWQVQRSGAKLTLQTSSP